MASPAACTVHSASREITTTLRVTTSGEVLADGTIIDLVRDKTGEGLSLVISAKPQKPKVLCEVEHRGLMYVPATLETGYLRLMQLPDRAVSPGDTLKLFNRITEKIQQLTGIEPRLVRLATHFAIATWFSDIFAEAPVMIITGPRLLACEVLRVLRYFCRRALLVQSSRAGDLGLLPLAFSPTLLIDASLCTRSGIRRLLVPPASDFAIPHRGGLVKFSGGKAIYTGTVAPPIREGGVRLPLPPTGRTTPHAGNHHGIAEEFQPRLLGYRLANYSHVLGSSFDIPGFAVEARALARNLGACIVGDSSIQDGVESLFKDHDSTEREEQASEPLAYIIEALLVCCHQKKGHVYVGKLAEMVSAISLGRGEAVEISARGLGENLKCLGLTTTRLGRAGRGLVLDRVTCDRVHRLGSEYGVRMLDEAAAHFPCCAQTGPNRLRRA